MYVQYVFCLTDILRISLIKGILAESKNPNLNRPEIEPKFYKYLVGFKFSLSERTRTEKKLSEYTRCDKNRFVPDLKT